VTIFALYWNFGTRIFDREELVPVLCLMLACTVHSLLFFVNFWSADINVFFAYSKINDIQDCTDIWIQIENKKQQTIKKTVVPRLSLSVEITPGKL
jgi:cation-transporting ATPase 13A1